MHPESVPRKLLKGDFASKLQYVVETVLAQSVFVLGDSMKRRTPSRAPLDWYTARQNIIRAMKQYKSKPTGTGFFIWYDGHSYPPKDIRSMVEKRSKQTFSGGGKTNSIFRELGFTVVRGVRNLSSYQGLLKRKSGGATLELSKHLAELFGQNWKVLDETSIKKQPKEFPGVYLLGYAKKLRGKVEPKDVFYVGMTTSLQNRLQQFWDGIHKDGHHSGAMTFFKRWGGGKSFARIKQRGTFHFATLPIKCQIRKGLRTPEDLRALGLVTALEYHALAQIKLETCLEPPLNKK